MTRATDAHLTDPEPRADIGSAGATARRMVRAFATGPAPVAVRSIVTQLRDGLAGRKAAAVVYFASSVYRPEDIAGPLTGRMTEAEVIGCSTAGEFTDAATGTGGISAIALPTALLPRRAAALADLGDGSDTAVAEGVATAVASLERKLGTALRDLQVDRNLGLVLMDGMHGTEEAVTFRIGDAAPALDLVGGSAGDDLAFESTWVAVGDRVSRHGAALLICGTSVPYRVVKSCSFTPSGKTLTVTKADLPNRIVHEFNGRPAVEAYAEAVGRSTGEIDSAVFMAHPVGLMIDGQPFIRSPRVVQDGSLAFYSQIMEGMSVDVMNSTDLVGDTAAAVAGAVEALHGASGALMVNCVLRRLEIDANELSEGFLGAFHGVPTAGFHSYGETWLGHINQTLTGVVFG